LISSFSLVPFNTFLPIPRILNSSFPLPLHRVNLHYLSFQAWGSEFTNSSTLCWSFSIFPKYSTGETGPSLCLSPDLRDLPGMFVSCPIRAPPFITLVCLAHSTFPSLSNGLSMDCETIILFFWTLPPTVLLNADSVLRRSE